MTDTSTSTAPERTRFRRSERDWDRIAVIAIVLGAGLRILWVLVVHSPVDHVYSDMLGYVRRAQRFASGAPLTPDDAFFPPGTHVLLSIPLRLFGLDAGLWVAAVAWCSLSIATVYMSWRLARELLTPAAAALTAVLCAGWPLFITYGGYFTSETPALALLVAALWAGVAATRREGGSATSLALLSGLLGGTASAFRPQLLLNVVIMMVIVLLALRRRLAPIACFAAGLVAVLALVVVHNSVASNQVTGLATNGGINFWFGHCDARQVITVDAENRSTGGVRHPVPSQAGRPGDFVARDHEVWDEDYFLGLGWECVGQDGPKHVFRLARNVLDMTATTTPWPQNVDEGWPRDVVQAANLLYSVLLPWIVIEAVVLRSRRRRKGESGGETFLLLHLACVVVVAVLVIGDPRVRAVYDVFGFALLSVLLADRLRLDGPVDATPRAVDGG